MARYQLGIESYNDPPRTLEELQDAVADPRPGYHIHHIVEQAAARAEGYPEDLINSRENLVRIPSMKHWEVTSWFMTEQEDFNRMSPRDYLVGRDWKTRYNTGLTGLRKAGIWRWTSMKWIPAQSSTK